MMPAHITTVSTRIALIVLILDSLYLLFMFIAFPLMQARGYAAFFAEAAQTFGVGQRGFIMHWVLGLIATVAVIISATHFFARVAANPSPLIAACIVMMVFTIGSGLYLRGHLGTRHVWRIGICLLAMGLALIARTYSEDKEKPNHGLESTGAPPAAGTPETHP